MRMRKQAPRAVRCKRWVYRARSRLAPSTKRESRIDRVRREMWRLIPVSSTEPSETFFAEAHRDLRDYRMAPRARGATTIRADIAKANLTKRAGFPTYLDQPLRRAS